MPWPDTPRRGPSGGRPGPDGRPAPAGPVTGRGPVPAPPWDGPEHGPGGRRVPYPAAPRERLRPAPPDAYAPGPAGERPRRTGSAPPGPDALDRGAPPAPPREGGRRRAETADGARRPASDPDIPARRRAAPDGPGRTEDRAGQPRDRGRGRTGEPGSAAVTRSGRQRATARPPAERQRGGEDAAERPVERSGGRRATRAADPRDAEPRDANPRADDGAAPDEAAEQPRTGRRRVPEGSQTPRAVGTSKTGRSVARAQADAGTERVPARRRAARDAPTGKQTGEQAPERDAAATTRTRRARGTADEDTPPSAATTRTRRARETADEPVPDAAATTRTRRARESTDEPTQRAAATRTRRAAEPEPRGGTEGARLRADRIDETLTRLTAAHAGLVLAARERDDDYEDDLEDDHDEPDAVPAPPPAHPALRVGRIAVAGVALLLVLVSGLGWVGRTRLDGALHRVAAVDVPPDGVVDAAAQAGDRNVLLLATDSGGSERATTRANTVVVVHTDAHTGRTAALTLPADLEITRPPCERWDAAAATYLGQTVPAEPRTTFDSAYAVGGPRCATRAAQQVTGLAVTGFAAVDLSATSALVESVGGVDVCVERPVLDAVVGPVVPAPGTGSLNGARAGDLVRATDVRDDPAPATDLVQRQQRVLAAALSRALSPERLLNPGRTGRVLPALGTAVVSTGTGVDDLLAVSRTLGRTDGTLLAVPTEPATNSRGNRVLRDTDAAALFLALRTDGPLPAPDPAAAATAPAPSDVTADVLNASGRDGLAAQVAGTLGDLGFHTGEVTNATQPALDTVVRFSPDRAQQARLLAAAVPTASAVPDPGTSGVLQLVLGRSFDGTVRAATAPPDPAGAATASAPAVSCD